MPGGAVEGIGIEMLPLVLSLAPCGGAGRCIITAYLGNYALVNPLFCRSGPWRASMRSWFSGLAPAASESCQLDSTKFARSSRAVVRYPKWVATTTSRPRRPLVCSAQGSLACGAMRLFSPGATSSWTGAASLLACSRLPPAPRVQVAPPILTSKTATSSTPRFFHSPPSVRDWI